MMKQLLRLKFMRHSVSPYKMSFEQDESWKSWITYNSEKDIVYWDVMQVVSGNTNYAKEGLYASFISILSVE
ncbi:hypothetical protein NXX53_18195 [Bacteroides salyersiae]|nr:hypothetical protein [Bacteroides salyersiae]